MRDAAGRLERVWLRPGARVPVREVDQALAVAGVGLEGDHAQGGKRQVTLLSFERWSAACAALDRAVDPAVRRANLLVSAVSLDLRRDGLLRIGEVRLRVRGETRPCELLEDDGGVGLYAALRDDVRAGVFATIELGGVLRIGDEVAWEC